MNTIKQLIEKYCSDGVEYKKLGEIGNLKEVKTFKRLISLTKASLVFTMGRCIHTITCLHPKPLSSLIQLLHPKQLSLTLVMLLSLQLAKIWKMSEKLWVG